MCQAIWGSVKLNGLCNQLLTLQERFSLCLWNNNLFVSRNLFQGCGFIGVEGTWKEGGHDVIIINIYSPCDLEAKKRQWEALKSVRATSRESLWFIIGDYNCIRRSCERQGESLVDYGSGERMEFDKFIVDMELKDISLVGWKFTWYQPNGKARCRIDRCLVLRDWIAMWPESSQYVLDKNISDHCPMLLKDVNVVWGLKPFRSPYCWFKDKQFEKLVVDTWSNLHRHGKGDFILKEKLKGLKGSFKEWNQTHFGNINNNIARI